MNDMLTISKATAKQLYSLYDNIQKSDRNLKACQNGAFRQHMKDVANAPNVKKAFAMLEKFLADTSRQE